jgi:hypothetical protein
MYLRGMSDLTYNSVREELAIPEYGRAVHQMVAHALTLADRAERNRCAEAIVSIMASVAPQDGSPDEVRKRLWGHLMVISGYALDVDSPYPLPTQDSRLEPPARLSYPGETSRLGHYGALTRKLVERAKGYEPGPEKDALVLSIANLLKRHFLTWNRPTVEDAFIAQQLKELSNGELTLAPEVELAQTAGILQTMRKTSDALERQRSGKKKNRG